jgi:adenylate kinase
MKKILLFILFSSFTQLFSVKTVVLIGAPGAGKGTVTQFLKNEYGATHLCVGDILRKEIQDQTPEGLICKNYVLNGDLVPQEIVFSLFSRSFEEAIAFNRSMVIVDGMVQSEENILFLDTLVKKMGLSEQTVYLYLVISEQTCKNRLLNRLICPMCQKSFSKDDALENCDSCGGRIEKRSDDNEAAIQRRIIRFFEKTIYLIDFYQQYSKFYIVDGEQSPQQVIKQIRNIL